MIGYIDPKPSQMLGANMNSKVEEKKSDIQRTKESMGCPSPMMIKREEAA